MLPAPLVKAAGASGVGLASGIGNGNADRTGTACGHRQAVYGDCATAAGGRGHHPGTGDVAATAANGGLVPPTICKPPGRVSMKLAVVAAAPDGLASVKVSVVAPPSGRVVGLNALVNVGNRS